ncbi:MAG: efflux transporter outer membrane subunit [Gammaproteobacteria bacterium]|nr:efflux transporter outer membrane subunit [Gammaproteobacteria bacterium]
MKPCTLRNTLLCGIAASALSGCVASGADAQKPDLPLPAALPAPVAQTTPAGDLPDPWWALFGDAALDALVDEALDHNPDMAVATARVAQARALLGGARAERWPTVALQGTIARAPGGANQPAAGDTPPLTVYTVQGAAGFELDLWGRYWRASQSARAQLMNSEFDREAAKLSLSGDVARGYFGLIAAAQQLARGRGTLAAREESLRIERLRRETGESDEFTLRRAEADTAATRTTVAQLELDLVRRTHALGVLLGRSPQDLVERAIGTGDAELPALVMLPAALPSRILERRPDIRAAAAALQASAYDIGVARAQMFPSISLTGALGSVSAELDSLFRAPARTWSAAAGVLQPVFQGGRLRANLKRAQAVREERKAQYARTVQDAFREVLDALQGQDLIAGACSENAVQVAALRRATAIAELRYRQGDIAYTDLLDVRRGLLQAEIALLAAQRDALLNTVDLALAVGGGLGPHAAALPVERQRVPPRTGR